jgi:UrcA family protein
MVAGRETEPVVGEFGNRRSSASHSNLRRNFTMIRLVLTTCIAVLMTGAVASSAFAATPIEVATGAVKMDDLNLDTVQGVHTLFHRVDLMAWRLCAERQSAALPRAERNMWECHGAAMRRAISQVHAPLVTAAYLRRFGKPTTRIAAR